VLVVDDEQAIRTWLHKSLVARGYEVELAATGAEADALLGAHRYDAIVCDIRMPGNGQQLYLALSQRDPTLARRMIFITGDVVNPATEQFFDTRGGYALSKPFTIEQLVAVLEKVMRQPPSAPA
jgi:two-component system NtrC family sensor kinase